GSSWASSEARAARAPRIALAVARSGPGERTPPRAARAASSRMSPIPSSGGSTDSSISPIASAVSACRRVTSSSSLDGTSARTSCSPYGVAVAAATSSTTAGNSTAASASASMARVYEQARRIRRLPAVLHWPSSMSRIERVTETRIDLRLARDGGTPARSRPEQPMFPGGMELGEEEAEAAARVIRSHNVFRYYGVGDGPHEVEAFEREFAAHAGAKHALCLNAGSSALICGLIGAGVTPGDEVIVPAYTWNATANAVVAARAIPVLAEVDESLTLDAEDVRRKLTPKTRAVVPVHMRGAPADMDALPALASEHGLALIEDVCQAAGATYRGTFLGTFGDAGA